MQETHDSQQNAENPDSFPAMLEVNLSRLLASINPWQFTLRARHVPSPFHPG